MTADRVHPSAPTPVSTILTASERQRVDAVASGIYQTLHRSTVDDVIRDLRENRAGVVLMSVACCGETQMARVASMVREFPRIPAVALLTDTAVPTAQQVLSLGHSGVRRVIDVRRPTGWTELRSVLMTSRTQDIQRIALAQLTVDLRGAPDDCWEFFERLFTAPARLSRVTELAELVGVGTSTLMSRFYRSELPSPRVYLTMARLVRAAELFENPGLSIANVSNHLDYSSPQSFGRHVRTVMRMTAAELRERYDGEGMLRRFREDLILKYSETLREFSPLRPGRAG